MANVLIVGCGDLGSDLAKKMVAAGHHVSAIRRTGKTFPDSVVGITGNVLTLKDSELPDVDIIYLILTPQNRTESGYREAYFQPAQRLITRYGALVNPPMLFFVSSTSVYGQTSTCLLCEDDAPIPNSPTAHVLLETEKALNECFTATSVRFSGIYGANRFRLIESVVKQTEWGKNQWTNRIHRDDCVGVLAFLGEYYLASIQSKVNQSKINQPKMQSEECDKPPLESVYIATDNTPVSMWEVKLLIASMLNKKPNLTEHEGGFAFLPNSGKRLSNQRLRRLGYQFQYPDYVSGYENLIQAYINQSE